MGELLAGFACGSKDGRNHSELSHLLPRLSVGSPRPELCPITLATADAYALAYRDLRRKGRPIPSNGLWIAASCLERGALLFSFDQHFEQVDGLRLIRRWEEALP